MLISFAHPLVAEATTVSLGLTFAAATSALLFLAMMYDAAITHPAWTVRRVAFGSNEAVAAMYGRGKLEDVEFLNHAI